MLQKGETGRDKAYHGAQVYAVSVTFTYSQYVKEIKEKLSEMEKSLDDRFDVSDGIISDAAKDVFFDMKEKFEYLQDEEYMSGFSNYNEINSAMPELVSADFEEKNDIIEATLEFNTEMKNIEDYIKISQGDKEIDKYVINSEGKIVKISFNNNYNYEDDYKITVSKYATATLSERFTMGLTKAYRFLPKKGITIANINIADESGKEIENIKEYSGSEIKISAKVSNNSKEESSYFAIAGLYDEKGQLVACKNIANTLQGGKSENVNTTLSTGGRSGLTLKIIWLDTAESMKTVADTIIK